MSIFWKVHWPSHSALHDLQGKVIIEAKKDEKLEVPDEATIEDKVRPDPWIVHHFWLTLVYFSYL